MKRGIFVGLVGLGLLVCCGSAQALYTPNPAGRWAENRFFLAGDFTYNADKDLDGGGEIEDQVGFFARPAFSIARNIMIYARVGMMDGKSLDSGFAGGFGVQGAYVLPRHPEWAIGGAFDFLYWDTGSGPFDLTYIEYQFTPAFSYNVPSIPQLTPYGGVAFDFLGSDFDEDKPFGLVMGTNYDPTNRVRLDAQFRVINETGFFISAGYMF